MPQLLHTIRPGQRIDAAATAMLVLARFTGCEIVADFNGRPLIACPGMTAQQVVRAFEQDMQRSYFGRVVYAGDET